MMLMMMVMATMMVVMFVMKLMPRQTKMPITLTSRYFKRKP